MAFSPPPLAAWRLESPSRKRRVGSLLPVILPEAKATDEGVLVVAQATAFRQRGQLLGVAAAQHDIVDDQRGLKQFHHLEDLVLPFLLAEPFQAADADEVLERLFLLVGQMAQFHRGDYAIDDQRVAQTGAQ